MFEIHNYYHQLKKLRKNRKNWTPYEKLDYFSLRIDLLKVRRDKYSKDAPEWNLLNKRKVKQISKLAEAINEIRKYEANQEKESFV